MDINLFNIKFIFTSTTKEVIDCLNSNFNDLLNIECIKCSVLDVPYADCLVSCSNSYGLMDIEQNENKTINILFNDIQKRIQYVIQNIYYGQQPIGNTFIIETFNKRFKFIAHSPIITLPRKFTNKDKSQHPKLTNNCYTSFRSLLVALLNHNKVNNNKINLVVCPFFYTDDLNVDFNECARQMRLAYSLVDMKLKSNLEHAKLVEHFM